MAGLPGLEVSVFDAEKLSNGSRNLWVRVEDPGGGFVSGLAPTEVILWEDGELVVDYQVSEARASGAIGVGFALCAEPGVSSDWVDAAGEAAAECLRYRRADDLWAVSKLSCGDRPARFGWNNAVVDIESGRRVEPPRYSSRWG